MLDYKLVEALAAVVREGGFEKAARTLHITQSAVSQRVRLLEEQTGRILLVRATPPAPTPAGQRMLRHYEQVRLLEGELDQGGDAAPGFTTLAVGVNADSLATWFLPALTPFLHERRVLLDLRVDDQDQTHALLRDGEVLGCVSSRGEPFQGCRCTGLGCMDYRIYATPAFAARWFPHGVTGAAARRAPFLVFNRKDAVLHLMLERVLGQRPDDLHIFWLPTSEGFATAIAAGLACGVLPDQQAAPFLADGRMVDVAPGVVEPVRLFWHRWNLDSSLLRDFSTAMETGAAPLLRQEEAPQPA
ncbi:MAG: LysR family transcriptional regulator ArgP [Desulfovibrionaceae bacterium]